jgi:hypothetical protein
MNGLAQVTNGASDPVLADDLGSPDFSFLPENLAGQCQRLIVGYHELHGYTCLPDILWKAGLGPFIETHREFRQILRKASTTRSAKKSNEGFVRIATTILSLEILASSFAGWSAIYPQAASRALAILKHNAPGPHMPLMEFYLYPPKHISSAVIATLAPPATTRQPSEADLYRASRPEVADGETEINYLRAMKHTTDASAPTAAQASAT